MTLLVIISLNLIAITVGLLRAIADLEKEEANSQQAFDKFRERAKSSLLKVIYSFIITIIIITLIMIP